MSQPLWQIGRWRGVPILLHWSTLLALLWFWFRYQQIVPALLTFFGFFALLLAHELGHAIAAHSRNVRVFGIRLYLLHGLCSHAPPHHERDDVFIAWGGVIAQSVILMLALVAQSILSSAAPLLQLQLSPLFRVLITGNLFMIAFNLIPVAPLDGYRAWRVLRPLRATLSSRVQRGTASLKRVLNVRKRRALSKDAESNVVDLLERIKKNKK